MRYAKIFWVCLLGTSLLNLQKELMFFESFLWLLLLSIYFVCIAIEHLLKKLRVVQLIPFNFLSMKTWKGTTSCWNVIIVI